MIFNKKQQLHTKTNCYILSNRSHKRQGLQMCFPHTCKNKIIHICTHIHKNSIYNSKCRYRKCLSCYVPTSSDQCARGKDNRFFVSKYCPSPSDTIKMSYLVCTPECNDPQASHCPLYISSNTILGTYYSLTV